MAVNTTPVFADTPQTTLSEIVTANTARDGSGTIVDGYTGAAAASIVKYAKIQAIVTTTAGMVRIFLKKSGGAYELLDEVTVDAITVSGTVAGFSAIWRPPDGYLYLESGDVIGYAPNAAEAMNVWTIAEDL